jgi:hypothetical protein
MELWSRRLTVLPGYIGAGVIIVGCVVAALGYVGTGGEHYSPLRYFVSELGHTQQSALSAIFNVALFIGGVFYGLFMLGVGLSFRWIAGYAFSIAGMVVAGGGALVGVYPMDVNLPMHRQVALLFFQGSLVLMIGFSLLVLLARQRVYPRWMAFTTLPMIVSNAILLRIIFSGGTSALAKPEGGRPEFWLVAISEWGVIIFLLLWVVLVAYYRSRPTPAA